MGENKKNEAKNKSKYLLLKTLRYNYSSQVHTIQNLKD